jgi:acyl-CoA synthetase (AMP-forming)/AMP-acid ligase II
VLTHRNVTAAVLNSAVSWEHDDEPGVSLQPWPLCHIAGYGVLVAHLLGDTVVVLRRYDPEGFLAAVQETRATSTSVAPTMLAMLLRHPSFPDYDTSSITRIGSADHVAAAEGRTELLTSVGKPMFLSPVRVVNERDEDTAPDEVGELVIRGDQVCAGYWNRPEATAEAFRGGWFHSGDLARRDVEGYVSVVDRKKDMILTGGENVYSREVEEILHQHPAVAAAAVVGAPDEVWGQIVVAVIEPRAGREPTAEDIREFCRDRLAGYKRPRKVLLVPELPRNTVGKVLKRELRTLVAGVDKAPTPS